MTAGVPDDDIGVIAVNPPISCPIFMQLCAHLFAIVYDIFS